MSNGTPRASWRATERVIVRSEPGVPRLRPALQGYARQKAEQQAASERSARSGARHIVCGTTGTDYTSMLRTRRRELMADRVSATQAGVLSLEGWGNDDARPVLRALLRAAQDRPGDFVPDTKFPESPEQQVGFFCAFGMSRADAVAVVLSHEAPPAPRSVPSARAAARPYGRRTSKGE